METRRILVTGGAGFIGSNLAKTLEGLGHDVTIADSFLSGSWRNLVGFKGEVITCDLSIEDTALAAGPFDIVFHQASITDTTVMDQGLMMRNNVEAFRRLLAAAQKWQARVVWASSAATYGRRRPPMTEDIGEPLNVYGYSKLAMEQIARKVAPRLAKPIVGLRYFNVYGPGEGHKGKFASMILQLAKQMRAGKAPRIFFSGEQKRDFVCVEDVVQANLLAMESKVSGVYNVGCGKAGSFNEIIACLNRELSLSLKTEYFENPYDFYQDLTEANLDRTKRDLGYSPKYMLAEGIAKYKASGELG